MTAKIFSCTFTGLKCQIVTVEVDLSRGLPTFQIVGLGGTSVQESKERVRASIKNCKLNFPDKRKIVNLAPAELRKQGSHFDLPIALGLLKASGQVSRQDLEDSIFAGELSLNGEVRPINGALAIAHYAKQKGFKKIFLPDNNCQEASLISGITIFPIENLSRLVNYLNGKNEIKPFKRTRTKSENLKNYQKQQGNYENFNQIIGHKLIKRALTIAAAGHHNVLLEGSPGCGKTLISRAFRDILPPMSKEEILETTKIYSISGLLKKSQPTITKRPFREVHSSATQAAILGGGSKTIKPGEVSLAHNGVLFFDEISEFPRSNIEALRKPLEDRYIHINRSGKTLVFPCNFAFIATTNPCPCGYYFDKKIKCKCRPAQIQKYRSKLSGPIIDRIDIFLSVESTEMKNIFQNQPKRHKANQEIRNQIASALEIQKNRFRTSKIKNSLMGIDQITKNCQIDPQSLNLLENARKNINLSNRTYLKTLKLARTIADLENSKKIKQKHLAEALQYRFRSMKTT